MDPTTDPQVRSFVAPDPAGDFPIQNLPYGVFRHQGRSRVGVAIGESVLDLSVLEGRGFFRKTPLGEAAVFATGSLNPFLALGRDAWREVRAATHRLLREDVPELRDDEALRSEALLPIAEVALELPVAVGDYTDFYSSREHATNVGTIFRGPENALMANWLHLPIAYHGRSSSLVVSGTGVRRPCGQTNPVPPGGTRSGKGASNAVAGPRFGPSRTLDFELEVGCFVGPGNRLGEPIPIERAEEHVFGMVLVNDWSARDIQRWEYQPLGPFLAKSFATTISPWVVTLEALEPFRCAGPRQDPEPLPYLRIGGNRSFDIELEVLLQTGAGSAPQRIARTNFRHLYWSLSQQVAHHTSGGCNLRPGDLLASGTISGPARDSCGSLLELTWGGKEPIRLGDGETRQFLEDGDTVVLRGGCRNEGLRIGFGEARGIILPAIR